MSDIKLFRTEGDAVTKLYGTALGSNYQAQGLKLSKHFRPFGR